MHIEFDGCGVDARKLYSLVSVSEAFSKKLRERSTTYDYPEGFLSLPSDAELEAELDRVLGLFKSPRLHYVVLMGIGGMSFGPRAIYETFVGFKDSIESFGSTKAVFLENADVHKVNYLNERLRKEGITKDQVVFIVSSKSGTTFEILKNIEKVQASTVLWSLLNERLILLAPSGNPLTSVLAGYNFFHYEIPPTLSDRYAVFSPTGMLVPALVGLNYKNFRKGAAQVVKTLEDTASAVYASAAVRFHHYQKHLTTDVLFCFDERIRELGSWCASITAESLGKKEKGITPITAVGSRDMHALGQLFSDGPEDKFTYFISLSDTDEDNKKVKKAVQQFYKDKERPFIDIEIDAQNLEESYGSFMQFKLLETALLGGCMNVNPFDQPGVEGYKEILRKL